MLGAFLICSSPASADPGTSPIFPKWEVYENKACYTLEGAKKLRVFQEHCEGCLAKQPLLEKKLSILSDRGSSCESLLETYSNNLSDLRKVALAQSEFISTQNRLLEEADAYSVFGGALPWVVASLVVAFSAGLVSASAL